MLNEIFDTCKTHGDKRGLGHINKVETPTSRETIFVKGKEETTSHATSFNIPSLCTNCKKFGHTQNRCYIKFL